MKHISLKLIILLTTALISLSSCSTVHRSMREPVTRVQLEKQDFVLSDQLTAEAHSTMVLGIDWKRIFKSNTGIVHGPSTFLNLVSIPVVGNYMSNRTANYSLYQHICELQPFDLWNKSCRQKEQCVLIYIIHLNNRGILSFHL